MFGEHHAPSVVSTNKAPPALRLMAGFGTEPFVLHLSLSFLFFSSSSICYTQPERCQISQLPEREREVKRRSRSSGVWRHVRSLQSKHWENSPCTRKNSQYLLQEQFWSSEHPLILSKVISENSCICQISRSAFSTIAAFRLCEAHLRCLHASERERKQLQSLWTLVVTRRSSKNEDKSTYAGLFPLRIHLGSGVKRRGKSSVLLWQQMDTLHFSIQQHFVVTASRQAPSAAFMEFWVLVWQRLLKSGKSS